jgi:nicotinate-nucleotide adenylyltransferase
MMSKRTIIAIYGGAFDPLHNGHLATIALLLNSGRVDEVVVVPSGDRPDKCSRASGEHRIAMVRLGVSEAFAGDTRVIVSDLHVSKRVGFGTIDLVDFYRADPTREVLVVIGHELVADLGQWKESERLKREARFLLVSRPGHPAPTISDGWNIETLASLYDGEVLVSSTSLRKLLREEHSCAGLMPACVIEYCRAHKLYR